jgi:hypothetical protein
MNVRMIYMRRDDVLVFVFRKPASQFPAYFQRVFR